MKNLTLTLILLFAIKNLYSQTDYYLNGGNIEDALEIIQNSGTITISSIDTIVEDLTIDKSVNLIFTKSGGFYLPENINLTLKCGIDANLFQIFYGDGRIVFFTIESMNGQSVKKYNSKIECVYPQWWGANSNDLIDDYTAIQKAINSEFKYIRFPIGEYLVSDEIDIEKEATTLAGVDGYSSTLPTINFISEDINKTLIHFNHPKDSRIINLRFSSTADNNPEIELRNQTCIKFYCDEIEATTNPYWANLDAIVENCSFSGFYRCLDAYGRNLKILHNNFSRFYIAIDINYDANFAEPTDDYPDNYYETHLLGFRGYDILDNRFHAGNYTSILVEGYNSENLYGCKISNNIHDTKCSFFRGSISESVISNNVIHRVYLFPAMYFYNSNYLTITNNFIGGEKVNHEIKRQPRYPIWAEYGIVFENRAFNINIISNQLNNIKKDAILFKKLCSNVIISENTITNFGLGLNANDVNYEYHNKPYEAYNRDSLGYAAIMIAYFDGSENNPFMNQFINNNINLRVDKINHGIWTRKKLDYSLISPNVFNIGTSTDNNKRYFYDYPH